MAVGEFPLGDGALGEGAPGPPLPPPPPGLFPEFSFAPENIKMRFTDPSVSESLNRKWLGMPRGVYAGFFPVEVGTDLLELRVDPSLGFSLLKVGSSSVKATVDIFIESAVQLNFNGHTAYPVFVIARSDYKLLSGTSARIFTRTTGATGQNEVQICKVDKQGANFVIDATTPLVRQLPVAVPEQKYGFMIEGSVADLASSVTMSDEVADARQDLAAVTQDSLNDRLVVDLDGATMTDRMALQSVHIQSNDYVIAPGDLPLTSLNVSGSFSDVSRSVPPFLTFPPDGTPTTPGAVAGPTDTTNNICPLVFADDGRRVTTLGDDLVYGRLSSVVSSLSGSLTFTVATPFVTGSGTAFLTELEDGDLIEGADGVFYEVLSRTTNSALELTTAYQSQSGSINGAFRRRFTLTMVSRTSGAELLAPLDIAGTIRFFSTAWVRLDQVAANAFSVFKTRGELPLIPEATDVVSGKVLLATAGGLVGSIRSVRDSGVLVSNNVHTLNFVNPGSVIDLGGGEAAISVVGDVGLPGPTGGIGPDGVAGAAGVGFSLSNPQIQSGLSGTTSAAGGIVTLTHTIDFTTAPTPMDRIDHLTGGISFVKQIRGNEQVIIDHIKINDRLTLSTIGEIQARIIPNTAQSVTEIKLFLGGFGA